MTIDELVGYLECHASQRDKLARVTEIVATIRGFSDDDFQRAIRAIKKRLGSPKLETRITALIAELARDRKTAAPAPKLVEPDPVPWVGLTDDDRATALEAAIAADPQAQGPYTVYGDYLSSIGDVHGELVTIGHALAKNPTHKAMRAQWDDLLERHTDPIWGPLGARTKLVIGELDWYMGFIRGCRAVTGPKVELSIEDVVRALLDDPGPARFAQRLSLPSSDGGFEPVARALAARPRSTLRTLAIGSMWHRIGDVSAMWPALAHLETLAFEGWGPVFGPIALPRLTAFSIQYGIAEGGDDALAALAPLFDAALPALRSLAIGNFDNSDELVQRLVRSKLCAQLVELDLREGTLGPDGVATLLAHKDRFASLTKLDLELNYIPDGSAIAELPFVHIGDQQRGDNRQPFQWE